MHPELDALFSLKGGTALITGGARHLGFDAASILAAAGCDVVITSRTLSSATDSAAEIRERYGVDALALELDQSRFAGVEQVVRRTLDWKGKLDVLVNNAGGGSGNSIARLFERNPEDIDRLIQTNLNGVIYCCREAGRHMAERRSGKIINIGSIAGLLGRDRRLYDHSGMNGQPVDYAAAKAGVMGLTRDLAGYLSPFGVCVNCISPGGFARNLPQSFVADYSDRTPLARMGRDGIDLKGAILFLASAASDYVTGHNLVVDGGFSIWR